MNKQMTDGPVLYLEGALNGQYIGQSAHVDKGFVSYKTSDDVRGDPLRVDCYSPYLCERKIDGENTEIFTVMVWDGVKKNEVSALIKARLNAQVIDRSA